MPMYTAFSRPFRKITIAAGCCTSIESVELKTARQSVRMGYTDDGVGDYFRQGKSTYLFDDLNTTTTSVSAGAATDRRSYAT